MPAFQYTALDSQGRKLKSVIEADNSRSASQQLKQRGLIPLELVAQDDSTKADLNSFFKPRGLSTAQLALFTRQLATLITAGLPLEDCLAAIAGQSEQNGVRNLVAALRSSVREGHSLAESMRRRGRAFSGLYCATVASGERSGHLDLVLQRLADYVEAQLVFRQKIQLALIYPVMLVILALLIVLGLMLYVVPEVVEVIVNAGQELPLMTRWLIGSSTFILNWGWLLLLVALGIVLGLALWFRDARRRQSLHRKLLHLPLLRSYSRSSNAIRYTSTLAILTQSGVALVEAMSVASEVVNNAWFKHQVNVSLEKVKAGTSLHRALGETGVFPPMMIHLMASGEATGELGAMLARASNTQEAELQRKVAILVGLFEPITLILMGLIVLGIVLAILMPILNLNQLIQ